MKTIRLAGILLATVAAISLQRAAAQPLDLTLYSLSYTQNFDNLGFSIAETNTAGQSGVLAGEWSCYTNAKATSPGSIAAGAPSGATGGIIDFWQNSFIGQFKNYASYYSYLGSTNFNGNETATIQTNEPNRCLGIRQSGAFGDPFAAFVLKIANTADFHNFVLGLDMLNLDRTNSTRTTIWTVDWGTYDPVYLIPTSFYPIAAYTNVPGTYHTYHTNITFPDGTINNVGGQVWIRVIALAPSSGSGNRESFGIDNVSLTWANGSGGCTAVDGSSGGGVSPGGIFANPVNTIAYSNAAASFAVTAVGTSPVFYQWYKDGSPLTDGATGLGISSIFGSRAYQISIANISALDQGAYSCQVSNSCGTTVYVTNSTSATLTVTNPPAVSIGYLRTLTDPSASYAATNTTAMWHATGIITTFTNQTTGNTTSYYLQDATGGINLFITGNQLRPNLGDEVDMVGFLSSFAGALELEADETGAILANNATYVTILSNNVANYPVARIISWTNLVTSVGNQFVTNVMTEQTIKGSLCILTNVYFGTNANRRLTNNNPVFVANYSWPPLDANGSLGAGHKQGFVTYFYGQTGQDLTNKPLPSFAYAVQGALVTVAPNWNLISINRFADMMTNNLIIKTVAKSGNNTTLTWDAIPLTYSYSVYASATPFDVAKPLSVLNRIATNLKFATTAGTYTDPNATGANKFYRVTTP